MGKLSSRDRKLVHRAGENVSNIENGNFALAGVSWSQVVLQGPQRLVASTGFLTTTGTVYWHYIGYTQKELVVDYVKFVQTAAAAGTQAAEVYLASSPEAPDGTAKSLTVLFKDATLDNLITGGFTNGLVKGNATAAAFTVSPAVHLWAAGRFAFTATPTQPAILGSNLDLSIGFVQSTASVASAMVVGDVKTGALVAIDKGAVAIAPAFRIHVKA